MQNDTSAERQGSGTKMELNLEIIWKTHNQGNRINLRVAKNIFTVNSNEFIE